MNQLRQAIVRVWHGNPYENGTYLGTSFFIAPGYLVTSKHVVKDYDFREIFLVNDTGAWLEGGLRKIEGYLFHPELDLACLPLVKPVPDAICIELAADQVCDLEQGQRVRLMGYTTKDGAVETLEIEITAYLGVYDLDVAHTPVGRGMSGGPVLLDGQLVGVTTAKDSDHTFMIRVNSFREFLSQYISGGSYSHRRSIFEQDLRPLKDSLDRVDLGENIIISAFRKVAPQLVDRLPDESDNLLYDAIDLLANRPHRGYDRVPLIEFLKALPKDSLPELESSLQRIAEILGIDWQKVPQHTEANPETGPILTASPPVLVVKLEPSQLFTEVSFRVRAWLYVDGEPDPLPQDESDHTTEELGHIVPTILGRARRLLSPQQARDMLVELIIPLSLWHWNLSSFQASAGPLMRPLGELYPIVLRSWERIYDEAYDSIRYQWGIKWKNISLGEGSLGPDLIYCESGHRLDIADLYTKLGDHYLVFATLFPITDMPADMCTLFGTVIAAGMPFAFWSVGDATDSAVLRKALNDLITSNRFETWPQTLQNKRQNERRDDQKLWRDIQLLWDNPERIPPDANYQMMVPE